MTRDEAIKELELIAKVTMWNDRREAVEMAIEVLKQEPIVRCKECKHLRLYNEDTHLIVCGYEWCAWWQRPVISTGYCYRGEEE